jgi:Ca2+-binding RTX toxin-like protein
MPRTSSRPRRLGRVVAGFSVAAAATAATLLGAAPAYAQTGATAQMLGSQLSITGAQGADAITANGGNGVVTLSNTVGSITAGPGCQQLGGIVQCTGLQSMSFRGLGGDDAFRNNTNIRSTLSGGSGNDRLSGGSVNDRITGGLGVDFAFGLGGFDTCTAENESSCEA